MSFFNYNKNVRNGNKDESTAPLVLPPYLVSRNVLLQDYVADLSEYKQRDKRCKYIINDQFNVKNFYKYFLFIITDISSLKESCHKFSFISFLFNLIPILKWVPKYSIKNNLVGDITAGITVAVMHIPQGNHFQKLMFP